MSFYKCYAVPRKPQIIILLLLTIILFQGIALAGGGWHEATFSEISYLGNKQFELKLEEPEGHLATFDSGAPGLRILLSYKKVGWFESQNRKMVSEQDFVNGVNTILQTWKPGQRVRFGLMGTGLNKNDQPAEFDAISYGLKILDGVIYSFD